MMGKSYQHKTNRSRRKMQKLDANAVKVELADGKAAFQMILPLSDMLFDVAKAIEHTASQAGLLMMKALIDEEVEQLAGERYRHNPNRQMVPFRDSLFFYGKTFNPLKQVTSIKHLHRTPYGGVSSIS